MGASPSIREDRLELDQIDEPDSEGYSDGRESGSRLSEPERKREPMAFARACDEGVEEPERGDEPNGGPMGTSRNEDPDC